MRFSGKSGTDEWIEFLQGIFEEIYESDARQAAYWDFENGILEKVELPADFTDETKQAWHDNNRRRLAGEDAIIPEPERTGYPFVQVPALPEGKESDPNAPKSLIELVSINLQQKTQDPRYFNGEEVTIYEGINRIVSTYNEAGYDIPFELPFGLGAGESTFDITAMSTYEKTKHAYGIFQFIPGTFETIRKINEEHPERWSSFRKGPIGEFTESEWQNPLVQTELFCAYYVYIQEIMRKPLDDLTERIRKIDPGFPCPLDEIAAITSYNAGENATIYAINQFIALSDEEIICKAGDPPYGKDLWLAIIKNVFGDKVPGTDDIYIGMHVFTYAAKTYAMGSLLMAKNNESTEDKEDEDTTEVRHTNKTRSRVLGVLATGAGLATAAATIQRKEISRRTVIQGLLAAFAASTLLHAPLARAARELFQNIKEKEQQPPTIPEYINYEDAVAEAKTSLSQTYEALKNREKVHDKLSTTPEESAKRRYYTMPRQLDALKGEFTRWFGDNFLERFRASKKLPTTERKPLYEEGGRLQEQHLKEEIEAGNVIKMEPNDPSQPYFCEQVGENGGTDNNPAALYMRKEFLPLMGSLIELVNYQIDMFNTNPAEFGYPGFPKIPHISAIKISGAHRPMMQLYERLTSSKSGSTTKDTSSHIITHALDIGAFSTPGSHMVRFVESMKDESGKTRVEAGEKLPSEGFGKQTRNILSRMIGRSLLALQEPMKKQGITVMPLWEGSQLNWHVAIA